MCASARGCLLAAASLLAFIGCSDAPGSGAAAAVRDSAGVTIVENTAASWTDATAWQVAPEPVVSIGSVDAGDPAALFTTVRGLIRLSTGDIVVVDGTTSEIRWFDSNGAHIATRGGEGRGPGEFNAITQLKRLPGDTVLAQDAPLVRQVLYSPSAELVREERLDFERYRSYGRWLECMTMTLPDRSLLGCLPEPGLPAAASNTPGRLRTYARYVRVPWTMEAAYPLGLYGGIEQWAMDVGGGQLRYAVHPFHARTALAAGGDPLRVAIALNPEYSIEVWSADGRLDRIIRRVDALRTPTSQERLMAREEMAAFGFQDEALFNRLLADMPEPDSVPAVGSMVFGPAGDLWVTRAALRRSADSTTVDVFDPEGTFLGEVRLPPGFRLFEVGGDYLLGVRHDELDVPSVELYRLTRLDP